MSWTLTLYHRLVPVRWRLAARGAMPPRMRAAIVGRLAHRGAARRLFGALAVGAARLRYRRLLSHPGHLLVRADGRFRVARVHADACPARARRETLEAVIAAFTAAGVPFFCVRGYGEDSSAVAVSARDRSAAFGALATASRRSPAYLARVVAGRPQRPRPLRRRSAVARRARVARFARYSCDPTGSLVLGVAHGCDVEVWEPAGDVLRAPRPNRVADTVPLAGPTVRVPESAFLRTPMPADPADARDPAEPRGGVTYPTRPEFAGVLLDEITFPIDVVYTWVDGADPAWRARRDRARAGCGEYLHAHAANDSRYISRDELKYSMRSLHQFAPWANHIWLVTDDQVPAWLAEHPRITVVSHRRIFGDQGLLPTFNSHAIESRLHHIENLAEHFLYFNDDVLLGRPIPAHAFFHANGITRFFPSTAKIDPGPADASADPPVTVAGKNNRRLVQGAFDRRVTYKMKHCPHALRRSVLAEIEERFPVEIAATARHQFRHLDDVSLPSSLYHYYAHATGRATIGELQYMYTNLANPDTATVLRLTLLRRDFDVMCINDTDSDPAALAGQQRLLAEFLEAYYPVPAPWERLGS